MSDEERHEVGICYKQKGNEKAVELGHSLVNGEVKESRVNACLEFIQNNPNTHIYCFRGGQRSQIIQSWIDEAGVSVPRLKGGYKAFRAYLMESTTKIARNQNIVILAGRTGSGKTIVLNKMSNSIDLEGLAHHRGSSFGNFATKQPTQIDFESALSYDMIRHDHGDYSSLVLEDESKNIGRCFIPNEMYQEMQSSDVVLLEQGIDRRIEITYDEYVLASQAEYSVVYPDDPEAWMNYMRESFKKISRRLGGDRYKKFSEILESAWTYQLSTADASRHKEWIVMLLNDYYDPMYDYQILNKKDRIIFSGNESEIEDFLGGYKK